MGFGRIQPELLRYCAEFTAMCNNICRNTERIDHKLVKNTLYAARIGCKLFELIIYLENKLRKTFYFVIFQLFLGYLRAPPLNAPFTISFLGKKHAQVMNI